MTLERIYWARDSFLKHEDSSPITIKPIGDPVDVEVPGRGKQYDYSALVKAVADAKGFASNDPLPNAFSVGRPRVISSEDKILFSIQYYSIQR